MYSIIIPIETSYTLKHRNTYLCSSVTKGILKKREVNGFSAVGALSFQQRQERCCRWWPTKKLPQGLVTNSGWTCCLVLWLNHMADFPTFLHPPVLTFCQWLWPKPACSLPPHTCILKVFHPATFKTCPSHFPGKDGLVLSLLCTFPAKFPHTGFPGN